MPVTPYSNNRKRQKSEAGNPRLIFGAAIIVVVIGCALFLDTRDIPAPRHAIEKVIGNERFFK